METGVRLVLSCLLVRLPSLSNVSMKKTIDQQTLVNTIGPITLSCVPRLPSPETRSTSIRTQFRPKCDPTPSDLHIQFGIRVISVKLFVPYSAPKRNKGFLDRAARKRDTDVWDRPRARARFGAAQFIHRRRESPGSEGNPVRAMPEGRRQAVEHAQIHGGVTQGLHARW
jgi:hypothetical protein